MERIFLIGYMGAGKTTLGKALSKALGVEFIDMDLYIEQRYHCTVRELFAERGEEAFRKIEQTVLHEVGEFEGVLVATGGGTPCFFDNMDYMNRMGTTVFLQASEETLFKRLQAGRQTRPILLGKTDEELRAFITTALAGRMPSYRKAKYTFPVDRLDDKAQISEAVLQFRQLLRI